MRALRPETLVESHPAAAQERSDAASLSLRAVTALEVASVITSVLITAWVIVPLQLNSRWLEAVPGLLALALMINSHRVRGERPRELGFTMRHFDRALWLLAAPMLLTSAVLIGCGYVAGSLSFNTRFWQSLLILPFWGLAQQYTLQAFVYRRLRFIFVDGQVAESKRAQRTRLAIFTAALLFALVHAPNLALMGLTLAGGLVWSWVYERAPNLFALGLSHGIMSAIAMSSLPAWLLQSMSIGYKHLLYQRF